MCQVRELASLRNGSLFDFSSESPGLGVKLRPRALFTLPLQSSSGDRPPEQQWGDSIDVEIGFELPSNTSAAGFGVSVLAGPNTTINSTMITIDVGSPLPTNGSRFGKVTGRLDTLSPPPVPCGTWTEGWLARCPWEGSFELLEGESTVDLRVLVDRSVVEVFVARGQVASLVAYQPPDLGYTNVHVLSGDGRVATKGIHVWSMGCGWNETQRS